MFLDIVFPTGISEGAVSGPRFQTDVVIEGGGGEVRNQVWSEPLREYDVARPCKDETDREDLISFFRVVRGKAYAFKFWDHADHEVETGEGLLRTLTASTFQLYRRYTRTGETFDQDIILPKSGTVVVKQGSTTLVEGSHYSINYKTGVLTIIGSPTPAPSSWTGDYYVMARFDTDRIGMTAETIDVFRSQNIPIIEVRAEEEAP